MIERVGKTAVIHLDHHLMMTVREDDQETTHVVPAIAIDEARIARFCLSADTALTRDLIMLCAAIWWADRRVTRKRAMAWARRLELIVPAFEHKQLTDAAPHLVSVLRYLTGDDWVIGFEPRNDVSARVQGLPFANPAPAAVMPFSDGLDSFAQYRLLCAEHREREVWRVRTTTRNRRKSEEKLLHMPLSILDVKHPEPSFRTRAFVFLLFAALAASASGANLVVIAENGQGSLAPSLLPFANEWPFRSTHPVFVRRLERFLAQVLPAAVQFLQPQLWRTKGEVLALMASTDDSATREWNTTKSCSNNHRYLFGEDGCGFCGGCILRRASVMHAGLDASGDNYGFDPAATELVLTDRGGRRAFSDNEADILSHGLRSMQEFGELAARRDMLTRLQSECMDLDPDAPAVALQRLLRLAGAHKNEFDAFKQALPEGAALRRMGVQSLAA